MALEQRSKFIKRVLDEITAGYSIPTQPKPERLDSIIDTAVREFRDNDDRANEVEYLILRNDLFQTPLFKAKRQVELPECVLAVTFLKTLGSNYFSHTVDKDFQKTNFGYVTALSGNSYDMLTSVVNSYYVDFLRNFVVKDITHEFSPYTNMLTVTGRDPFADLCAEAHVYIPEGALFKIPDFFNYVCAKCRINFGSIYGFISAKQMGGYDINASDLKSEGKEVIEKIEQKWEEQKNDAGFFFDF